MTKDMSNKLEALYKKYNGLMYSTAFRILNDHQLAQDAVQMSFVKIIKNIEIINDIECNKTKGLMVIICRNLSIDLYNKRKLSNSITIEEIDELIPDYTYSIDEQLIKHESLIALREKIKMLHQPYADIISLKYFYEFSDKEIAKILDISEQNARVRLHRAKTSLIDLIKRNESKEGAAGL
jgi:RNA polymerase sigma-70 factor (ECF subfamily)